MLNVALFGKPSKDKVEMNERELKSLKNISKQLKKRGEEGRNQVGKKMGKKH